MPDSYYRPTFGLEIDTAQGPDCACEYDPLSGPDIDFELEHARGRENELDRDCVFTCSKCNKFDRNPDLEREFHRGQKRVRPV